MTEKGVFVLGGPETQLHDILWAVHDGKKTVVEARGRKISGSSRLRWEVRGRAMRVSLVHVRACVRGVPMMCYLYNQSGSFGSIFLALATPSIMVPMMPKAIFTFG